MVDETETPIVSTYASNVGQLVVNLANRGYMVRIQAEKDLFNKNILYLQVNDLKATTVVKQALSEGDVEGVSDISLVADAISERLRKVKK